MSDPLSSHTAAGEHPIEPAQERPFRSAHQLGSDICPSQSAGEGPSPKPEGEFAMNLDWLYKLYGYAIGYMVAVIVALNVIAALAAYLAWLVVIIALLIVARLVWWYTNY